MAIKAKSFTISVSSPPTDTELSTLDSQVTSFLADQERNGAILSKTVVSQTMVISSNDVILTLTYQEV